MKTRYTYFIYLFLFVIYGYNNKLQAENSQIRVIFEDNFDQQSSIPDISKWSLCPSNNASWAKYLSMSNDQAYIQNGLLILKAEKVNGVYKTGGIQTKGKVDFLYGKIEVNAKFISAKGAWPAIWMMPTNQSAGWPACGEIDIMEQLNHDNIVYQTIHNKYKNVLEFTDPVPTKTHYYNVNEFNTYSIEWSAESIVFSVNGMTTFSYPNLHLPDEATKGQWPYNKSFYLILNCALGGAGTWPGVITDSELPATMQVDWVKVTQEVSTKIDEVATSDTQVSIKNGQLTILNSKNKDKISVFNSNGQLILSKVLNDVNSSVSVDQSYKVLFVQIDEQNGIKHFCKVINN